MLIAPFLLTRAAVAGMYQKKWGRLIHISSAHGHRASPFKSAYVSAKHGLEGFSKTIALEAGPFGVTSNTIAPAYVRTPLVEKQITSQAEVHGISEAEVIEKIMLTAPVIKRLIEPNEIGDVALFLCSESAGMITGTSIVVDGGWLAR
jgi:3-hydroxybutyrate dehydrogenase